MAYGSVNVPGASGQALEEVRGAVNAALNRANTAYGAANAAAAQLIRQRLCRYGLNTK